MSSDITRVHYTRLTVFLHLYTVVAVLVRFVLQYLAMVRKIAMITGYTSIS